ncbi:hypothetical protein I8751_02375 [Nostocaceae cyanobacterium CENA357]|uniref:Uncharacterized protein n=1 Tax=Atlanticothrix silvestris CENA357 TaxID=1725252 RepID=A0A8J7HE40_9CYAN|nr:hypothetical protein [Atlanticothrix silvestris]MBH8551245.1 hypothetical protein [Atlanticothrix silvestris CENA357]
MKDNLSLIAAAAGGFILSVALAGILRGTPVTAWQGQSRANSYLVANQQHVSVLRKNQGVTPNKNGHG